MWRVALWFQALLVYSQVKS